VALAAAARAEDSKADYVGLAAQSAPRAIPAAEAPPAGLVAVHRCTAANMVTKARTPGIGQSQHSTVTTRFGAYSGSSSSIAQTLQVTTGEFVEEYRVATPLWWLPYGLAAEERRVTQPGTEAGFLWRGTILTGGNIPELGSQSSDFKAEVNEDLDWATLIANAEPQLTRFSTKKEVTVSTSAPTKVSNAVLGEVDVIHVSVEIRNEDSPARQEWKRDYAASHWVPVSFVRRDFNVKSQPVRELKCELESYKLP
jgi:hypothetical protein